MTYRKLLEELKTLTDEQLDSDVIIEDSCDEIGHWTCSVLFGSEKFGAS